MQHVLPEDVAKLSDSQMSAMRDLKPYDAEFRLHHARRGVVWVESRSSPTRLPDGTFEWVGFLRDITERKQAEHAMRTVQAQLMAALEAGGMGMWQWDVARDALHIDERLLKLLGRQRDALGGTSRDALAFVVPGDVEVVQTALHALATDAERRDFEFRAILPDGEVRWLAVRAKSERDAQGTVCRVTALHIDITQQKRLTEAQLHSQKLEALGTLAGGIAHDFNNILQAILGNATLGLLGLPEGHRVRHFLNEVNTAVARASDLVSQILTFSRPDPQTSRAISLAETVGEALKLVRATTPTGIDIRADLDWRAPKVAADPSKIHQVVVNLATNSAHALSASGGTIEVRVASTLRQGDAPPTTPELPPGRYVTLSVHDDGCGIGPSALPRVFDPFYTTKAVGEGTGLGLSVVHGIVTRLGGAVSVQSELGVGTTFSILLPALQSAQDAEARVSHLVPHLAGGERVLFVDDEKMLVTLGVGLLTMLKMQPTGFIDPAGALAAFEAAPRDFDVLVTDAAMPGLSGYELTERLRRIRPDLPVVMLSGFVGPDELARAEKLGIHQLLLKPVRIDDLRSALAKALSGPPSGTRTRPSPSRGGT